MTFVDPIAWYLGEDGREYSGFLEDRPQDRGCFGAPGSGQLGTHCG